MRHSEGARVSLLLMTSGRTFRLASPGTPPKAALVWLLASSCPAPHRRPWSGIPVSRLQVSRGVGGCWTCCYTEMAVRHSSIVFFLQEHPQGVRLDHASAT